MSLLEAERLTKRFGGVLALDGVSFRLQAGEFLAMIGPNGAGKSTCFNIVNGYLKPDAGRVRFAGEDVTGLAPRKLWRRGVGRTFQITQTFRSMTVLQNVQTALISHHHRTLAVWPDARTLYRDAALALLDRVGISADADRPAAELAYGDLKRLELAVALAHAPRLLLMDEPTAGMAGSERQAMMRLVAELVAADGVAVLFTEHDMDVVFTHAHRVLVLNRGTLIADGSPEAIRADPLVREVYLGGGTLAEPADG